MNRGLIPPLGQSTDGVMIFVSAMMAVPSLMIFLSVALPAGPNRVLNIACGGTLHWNHRPHDVERCALHILRTNRDRADTARHLLCLDVATIDASEVRGSWHGHIRFPPVAGISESTLGWLDERSSTERFAGLSASGLE